jgi:AraC-like DNA-binding protein
MAELGEEARPLGEIAREAGISRFHFIRQFDALFGMTPHQLRMRERLEKAKLLLAAGEQSVTEVCMEVGMSSVGVSATGFRGKWGQRHPNIRGGRGR